MKENQLLLLLQDRKENEDQLLLLRNQVDLKPHQPFKRWLLRGIIPCILAIGTIVLLIALYAPNDETLKTSISANRINSSKIAGLGAWNTCNPLEDSCIAGYICCIAPNAADIAANKATCRLSGLAPNDPLGCSASSSAAPSGSTSSGSTSSSLNSIVYSPDSTCGGSNGYYCPANMPCCSQYGWCGSSDGYCGAGSQSKFAYIAGGSTTAVSTPNQQSNTGNSGSFNVIYSLDSTCGGSNGYTCPANMPCCSQYGWCGSTDSYCGAGTQAKWAYVASAPLSTSPPNPPSILPPSPSTIQVAAWNDCKLGTDVCVSGFQCCVAPADRATGKSTCRQSGLPANNPSGCSNTVPLNVPIVSTPGNNFQGVNVGIGSWFKAIDLPNSNGNSWCNFPYTDASNGFAVALNVITENTNVTSGPNWEKYGKLWCGLEAQVTNPDTQITKTMYIIDAFDPRFVLTPQSIDIMKNRWQDLTGYEPKSGSQVIYNTQWYLTGGKSVQYTFGGPGDKW